VIIVVIKNWFRVRLMMEGRLYGSQVFDVKEIVMFVC